MKPLLSVIADVNIRICYIINKRVVLDAHEAHMRRIVSSQVLWLLLATCLVDNTCWATMILTEWSPLRIIIAADGMAIVNSNRYKDVCKIMRGASDCFFAIAGLQDSNDFAYDSAQIARSACLQAGSIEERAQAFEKAILPELRRVMPLIRRYHSGNWAILTETGQGHFTAIFAGGANTERMIAMADFTIVPAGDVTPNPMIVRRGFIGSATRDDVTGQAELSGVYMARHPQVRNLTGPTLLRTLLLGSIEMDIERATISNGQRRIGQPIVILQIDDSGAHYIAQGACPALSTAKTKSPTKERN